MLTSVTTGTVAGLVNGAMDTQTKKTDSGAKDAFSQQLLSILKDGFDKLGVPSGGIKVRKSEPATSAPSASSSPQCHYVVTVPVCDVFATPPGSAPRKTTVGCVEEAGARTAVPAAAPTDGAMPEVLFEEHDGWRTQNYATLEMAQWLATRLGGEVGTYEVDWSPGFEPPPAYYTVKFGDVEMNAGALALYFQPGNYVDPDRMAAMLMSGEGVNSPFVSAHFPELANA